MQLQKILKFYTVLLSVPLLEKIKKNKKKIISAIWKSRHRSLGIDIDIGIGTGIRI